MSRVPYSLMALLLSACLQLPSAPVERRSVEWREAEAALREQLPTARAVTVRICTLPPGMGVIGLTMPGPMGSLVVLVEADLSDEGRLRVLVHEWAHAMTWGATVGDDHDEAWGVAYSRAYRVVMSGWRPLE